MNRIRDPRATRQRLLWAAFREFHRVGYRGADLDRILRRAGVTKGALYHHFNGKRDLGYSVIEEILKDWILDRWLKPLQDAEDPLEALSELAQWGEESASVEALSRGCPLLGLAQELSSVDEGFRLRLVAIYERWRAGLVDLLDGAQSRGLLRVDVDPRRVATFIIASWQGAIGLAKAEPSLANLEGCREGLDRYLESLRPSWTPSTAEIR